MRITNSGAGSGTVGAITFGGAGYPTEPDVAAITEDGCSGTVILSGGTCDLVIEGTANCNVGGPDPVSCNSVDYLDTNGNPMLESGILVINYTDSSGAKTVSSTVNAPGLILRCFCDD